MSTATGHLPPAEETHPPLTAELRAAFVGARARYRARQGLLLGDFLEGLGARGAALAALMIALPFGTPVSLGPIATPASLMCMLLGWHLARGRETFPVPARLLRVPIPERFFRIMRSTLARLARRQRWHRPRPAEVQPAALPGFRRWCGGGVLVAAFLLAVPIPFLPMTNMFPALGVVAFAAAYLRASRRDFALGVGLSILGALIIAFVCGAIVVLGAEVVFAFWDGGGAIKADTTPAP